MLPTRSTVRKVMFFLSGCAINRPVGKDTRVCHPVTFTNLLRFLVTRKLYSDFMFVFSKVK